MIGELTNHLWQSTVFAVAAGLMTLGFRKNRARVRYWLWLSTSFKFLLPFWLLMSLGNRLEWVPAAQAVTAAPAIARSLAQMSQPFPETFPLTPSTRGVDSLRSL
jgi:bla regulator protein blaR1